MDEFDFRDEKPKRQRNLADVIWNLATIYFLASALCLGGFFIMIFMNPNSSFNPFPPPPDIPPTPPIAPPTEVPPTATIPPTVTMIMPSPSEMITEEPTLTPTDEPPILTATEPTTGETPTATEGVTSGMPFVVQTGNPIALDSTIFHPELGCDFLGVAGQAFDLGGAPIQGLSVEVTGVLDGDTISLLSLTGVAPQYGPGGYEIQLNLEPVASSSTLQVQLKDQEQLPLSDPIPFDTFDSCEQNLIQINFTQVR